MNLRLTLPSDVGTRLELEAQKRGSTVAQLAVQLLAQALPVAEKTLAVMQLLQQWTREDAALTEEQMLRHRDALQAFDEDRSSDRKLFERVLAESGE